MVEAREAVERQEAGNMEKQEKREKDRLDKAVEELNKKATPSIDDRIYGLVSKVDDLIMLIRKQWCNFITTYELTSTADRTRLPFINDTANHPILKLEVLSVGGGLVIYPNNMSAGIVCSVGSTLEGVEIFNLEYQVVSGTAIILIYARID